MGSGGRFPDLQVRDGGQVVEVTVVVEQPGVFAEARRGHKEITKPMHGYSSGTGLTEDLSGAQVFELGLGFEDREVEEMLTNLFSLRIRVTAPENLGQDRAGECDIVI